MKISGLVVEVFNDISSVNYENVHQDFIMKMFVFEFTMIYPPMNVRENFIRKKKQTNKYVLSGTLIIFRVDFNNSTVKETSKRLHAIPLLPDITSDTFFKVFPFCILIDPSMRITHTGKSIKNLFPADTILTGRYLDEIFRLIRPDIALEWSKVNSICLCSFDLK